MVHQLPVTLKDLYNGKTSKLAVQKNVICVKCKGVGGKAGSVKKCTTCNGQGVQIKLRQFGPGMVQQVQVQCSSCNGEGEVMDEKNRCVDCKGKKVLPERKVLEVHIDKGMEDEQKIVFNGESNQEPGVPAGDIVIVLDEKPHDVFKRKGMDLFINMDVNLLEALAGFERVITHLDDRKIRITQPAGQVIKNGEMKMIPNEGMPRHKDPFSKGRLYITFNVVFPSSGFATEAQLKVLETILPARQAVPMTDDCEDVTLQEADRAGQSGSSRGGHTHDSQHHEDDDDEGGHHHGPGGPGVQCANQ